MDVLGWLCCVQCGTYLPRVHVWDDPDLTNSLSRDLAEAKGKLRDSVSAGPFCR